LDSLDDLFAVVPEGLRLAGGLDLAPGLSEPDVMAAMDGLAGRNRRSGRDLVCFAGGGAYDHEVPAATRRLAFRSEFVTAYTPYQPEVAQGVLQALFEYQTLLCRLTGMEVANSSLYDGASAGVEAANLAAVARGAAGLVRWPGGRGAAGVVGEGQPFGTPLSFGGPYLGLFTCRMEHVRRLPGRLVGETVDVEGRRAYVTTLRTREQDIRREKASSNVCTNQTLIAVACAVQLAWLGTAGLQQVALRCARGARYTRDALLAIDGVEPLVDAPVLREFAVRSPLTGEAV